MLANEDVKVTSMLCQLIVLEQSFSNHRNTSFGSIVTEICILQATFATPSFLSKSEVKVNVF